MVVGMDDDHCDFCDLPRSQCIHGRPPPAPAPAAKTVPTPRKRPTTRARSTASTKPVTRRWTPPEVFKPLILTVLERGGGTLEAEEALRELEVLVGDRLLAGDRERTPGGELRWEHAARRARVALLEEGAMTKAEPGVWQLS